MRKTTKRILCSLLVVLLLMTSAPLGGFADLDFKNPFAVEASAVSSLSQLKAKFPQDYYWNHKVTKNSECYDYLKANKISTKFDNSVSQTPCANHKYSYEYSWYKNKYDCNRFNGATQCCGFAQKIAYTAYGSYCTNWTKKTSNYLSSLKPGDVIHYYGAGSNSEWGHWVMVISVSGSIVKVGEANYGGNCRIRWDRTMNTNNFSSYTVYVAPSKLPTSSTPKCTGYTISLSGNTENGKFYDSNIVKVTINPQIDGRNANDNEITSITLKIKQPNGKISTREFGTTRSKSYYFKGYPTGKYTFYAQVKTKYGSYNGSATTNYKTLTLNKTSLSNVYYTTNEVKYNRLQFSGIDRYLTVDSSGNVVSAPRKSGTSQIWMLIKNSDNSYTIKSAYNGKVLDVDNGRYVRGNNVSTYEAHSGNNQKWNITKDGDSKYFIRAFGSNSAVLDVYGGSTTDGTNVQLWTYNGGSSQKITVVKPYKITYNANGGSGAPSSQYKNHNTDITMSSTRPTRSGYTFLGWDMNKSATLPSYGAGSKLRLNQDVTFYAIWKSNTSKYTISYNANGGSGAPSSQTKNSGQSITLSKTIPTRLPYTFIGWVTDKSHKTADYAPGANFTLNKNTTLYALWEAPKFIGFADRNSTVNIPYGGSVRYLEATGSSIAMKHIIYSTGSTDTRVYLYDTDGNLLAQDDDSGDSRNFRLEYVLQPSTTYYYAVRFYSSSTTGNIKVVRSKEKAPAVPDISVTSPSKGRASVYWNNVSGETGYQVYYSTSASTTFKLYTTIPADKTSTMVYNLTSGKTYYFKVRAYTKVAGGYLYSSYSSVKSITIR